MGSKSVESALNDEQIKLLEKLADWIVRKGMTTPAILFLESVRPLNFVGSQVMVFFQPAVQAVFKVPEWNEFRLIMEDRNSIEIFLDLIEKKEAENMDRLNEMKKSKSKSKTSKKFRWFRKKTRE